MTVTDGVRLDYDGPVATVTLDRPDVLNAQTPHMWRALRDIGRELRGDTRVVVVRGAGRAFSAGLDRRAIEQLRTALVDLPADRAAEQIAGFQEAFTWLGRPDLISVAAVHGPAVGAGFQLALACDLRIVTEEARLRMAEVTLGLVPDLGGTRRLVETVGYARAVEICVTGRWVDAAEARRLGLANLVVPGAELSAAVADLAAAVLAGPRDAVVEIKALLAGATDRSPADQLRAERDAQVRRLQDLAGTGE
ncbi:MULTISPECIES: enoyl-CoA hydratase/isomerase family protein [unclassified Solwaraspora]|uniref:enoyl-CoA hydratase/isomerase family protein n=1 Tax=unclassified Solwaraspora TaxID=2627926 RepID=UPI00259B48D8|nr:enoyl-CoA hydratase/isomerase family protein [Solwaraspora sp. WMMA2056]WJK38347.1 enoyl-CoA hydratase/isomerase family protein [Solwaraspora sp. WMMA2056]